MQGGVTLLHRITFEVVVAEAREGEVVALGEVDAVMPCAAQVVG